MREIADPGPLVVSLVEEVVPWQAGRRGIADSSSLAGELGIDSLGLVTLAFRIGEEFEIEIDEDDVDLAAIETVGDVKATVRRLLERDHDRA
jgi:acyl carrier protein